MSWSPPELRYEMPLPVDRSPGIGCIGAGFIMADCQLPAYRDAGYRPVCIWSRDPAKGLAAARRHGLRARASWSDVIDDPEVSVLDIAVPPHAQPEIVEAALARAGKIRGILAQKPLALDLDTARRLVDGARKAGVTLAVNQNMRHDQSIRALQDLLQRRLLGEPVLATIEMRAIPHWMDWVKGYGKLSFFVMSIHHLDAFRFLFGNPERALASCRRDPRTAFPHEDGITMYILEYASGLRCLGLDDVWTGPAREGSAGDISIRWRVEGTDGLALGTIGWPRWPERAPSTLRYSCKAGGERWIEPSWKKAWFPDAFAGTMGDLLRALEEGREPETSGQDNLDTIALVEACYRGAVERKVIDIEDTGR